LTLAVVPIKEMKNPSENKEDIIKKDL